MRLIAALTFLLLAMPLAPPALAESTPVPDVELMTSEGPMRLAELRGNVVYVDFWASWCTPCRKSFPWMQTLHERYQKDGLVVLAINLDDDRAQAEDFLSELPVGFPVAFDPQARSAEQFRVVGMPSSYLIDRQGRIRDSQVGFLDKHKDVTERALQALLQE